MHEMILSRPALEGMTKEELVSQNLALQRAGAALLGYFAGRWPDGASPPCLGVVTDGIGVAFSPNYPAPCTTGWLELHGSGRAAAVTILPFADGSLFGQATLGDHRLH